MTNSITRHPAIVAEAIGTIDELSNGRVILGMGRGGTIRKMLELESPLTATQEAVKIILSFFAKLRFYFEYFAVVVMDNPILYRSPKDIDSVLRLAQICLFLLVFRLFGV